MVVLQIILAFGNYMNSTKRGAVYGFTLQSLDMVSSLPIQSHLQALYLLTFILLYMYA